MSNVIEVKGRLDTTEMEEQEAQWKLRLRRLNTEIRKTRTELRRTQVYAATIIGSVMSLLYVIVSFLPEPLRLVGTAAVGAVQAVVQAIMATALAFSAAGSANPIFLVQAAVAWIGVEIAVFGLIAAVSAQQKLDADAKKMQGQMRQLSNSLQGILGAIGGYGR